MFSFSPISNRGRTVSGCGYFFLSSIDLSVGAQPRSLDFHPPCCLQPPDNTQPLAVGADGEPQSRWMPDGSLWCNPTGPPGMLQVANQHNREQGKDGSNTLRINLTPPKCREEPGEKQQLFRFRLELNILQSKVLPLKNSHL